MSVDIGVLVVAIATLGVIIVVNGALAEVATSEYPSPTGFQFVLYE